MRDEAVIKEEIVKLYGFLKVIPMNEKGCQEMAEIRIKIIALEWVMGKPDDRTYFGTQSKQRS